MYQGAIKGSSGKLFKLQNPNINLKVLQLYQHSPLQLSCYDFDMEKEKGAKDSDLRQRGLSANSGGRL